MATFPLKILSSTGVVFDDEADSTLVPTVDGPLLVEYGYTNLIAAIAPAGVLKVVHNGKSEFYAVFGGALDVRKGGTASLYVEEINRGYEIDMARALAARDRNLDRIQSPSDDTDVLKAKAHLAKALARISAKNLSEGSM